MNCIDYGFYRILCQKLTFYKNSRLSLLLYRSVSTPSTPALIVSTSYSPVLEGTLLAGCTTSAASLRDIYILSLSYNTNSLTLQTSSVNETLYGAFTNPLNDTSKLVEVRVAYLALCVLTSARKWICDSNVPNLAQSLRADNQTDPLNLLWIAEKFQSEAITSAFV